MLIIPFLLWFVSNNVVHSIVFLSLGISVLFSRYLKHFGHFYDTLEIIFLFLLIEYLLHRIGVGNLFPLDHIISIVLLYLFLLCIKKVQAIRLNLKIGRVKNAVWVGSGIAVLSILGLSFWFVFQEGNPYAEMMPEAPLALIIPMGVGFAVVNSVYEEGIFRSIFLSTFSEAVGFFCGLVLQALWFSLLHYRAGFPSGVMGMVLTFLFGMAMGYLVRRTKGILVPIVIHAVADLSVFVLVVMRMKGMI